MLKIYLCLCKGWKQISSPLSVPEWLLPNGLFPRLGCDPGSLAALRLNHLSLLLYGDKTYCVSWPTIWSIWIVLPRGNSVIGAGESTRVASRKPWTLQVCLRNPGISAEVPASSLDSTIAQGMLLSELCGMLLGKLDFKYWGLNLPLQVLFICWFRVSLSSPGYS